MTSHQIPLVLLAQYKLTDSPGLYIKIIWKGLEAIVETLHVRSTGEGDTDEDKYLSGKLHWPSRSPCNFSVWNMHRQYAPLKHTRPTNLIEQNLLIWQQLPTGTKCRKQRKFHVFRGVRQEISVDSSKCPQKWNKWHPLLPLAPSVLTLSWYNIVGTEDPLEFYMLMDMSIQAWICNQKWVQ